MGPIYDKHHPWWVRRLVVSKRGLKGTLVVVDLSATITAVEKLDSLDKRLWRLEAMVMASTITIVAAAAGLFLR